MDIDEVLTRVHRDGWARVVATLARRDDDLERRTATIGWADPHIEVKIVDPVTGETVERGMPGEFCTRGYCTIVGRIKDLVIRGGENIYPREIEEFLHHHPDVEDVQVVKIPRYVMVVDDFP